MKKIPRIKKHQDITSDTLNEIIDQVNGLSDLHFEAKQLVVDLKNSKAGHKELIDEFIQKYGTIINNTPNIIEILETYQENADGVFQAEEGDSLL